MLTWLRGVAASLCAACAIAGCSGAADPPTSPSAQWITYTSARFVFRHTALDSASITQTAATLDRERARIMSDLGVGQLPTVTVTLYADRESMRAAVAPLVGSIPAFANGLITGADQIHIVSPNAAQTWSYAEGVVNIVHELAHSVSIQVNPTIGNNPRWLWETVALFEAGQIRDRQQLPYCTSGAPLSFNELNSLSNTIVYDVGGLLGEFIVSTWGRETLIAMIRANGNVMQVPGLTEQQFLARWATYCGFAAFQATSRPASWHDWQTSRSVFVTRSGAVRHVWAISA